jgi:hypothetical protein
MTDYLHEVIGGPAIICESDHFLHCPSCGSWLDWHKLGELLAHEDWCSRDHHTTPMPGQSALMKSAIAVLLFSALLGCTGQGRTTQMNPDCTQVSAEE